MHFTVTAEVDATAMFDDESADWRYCKERATFTHADACEFVLHCGDDEYVDGRILEMKAAGCSAAFIDAYRLAAERGAVRVIFYA